MSFQQLPIQVGTGRGLIRLSNTGRKDLHVRRVGLDWPGYGDAFLKPEDYVVAPGQSVDFPVSLPRPNCSEGSGRALGVVDTGEVTVRKALDPPGSALLRHKRQLACAAEYAVKRVEVEYGHSWRIRGMGPTTAMVGHLRVTRRQGSELVRLADVEGSVLYRLELPGRSTLAPGAAGSDMPLRISPGGRCDQHSLSQATAPFAFRLVVAVGSRRASLGLTPPRAVQAKASAMLRRACR